MSTQLAFDFQSPRRWQEIILNTRVPTVEDAQETIRFAMRRYKPEQYLQFARSTNCSMLFGKSWRHLCERVRRYIALQTEGDASCSGYDLSMGYDAQFYIDSGLIENQIAYAARECYIFERAMHDAGDRDAPSFAKMIDLIEQVNVKLSSLGIAPE